MRRLFKILIITFLLCTFYIDCFSKAPPDEKKYAYMMLSKTKIAGALADPAFEKFVFRFKTYGNGLYVLECIAIYADEDAKTDPIDLVTVTTPRAEKLKSRFRGILTLDRAMMDSTGIDGSFDLYFNPRKFKAKNGTEKNFISYKLDKTAHTTATDYLEAFFPPTGLMLNPSPPR